MNTDTYNSNIINTNSAKTNTLNYTHTPTIYKSKHVRYNPSRTNTYREHTIDTTLRVCHHTYFRG